MDHSDFGPSWGTVLGSGLFVILLNLGGLALAVYLVVKVLQWTGVL